LRTGTHPFRILDPNSKYKHFNWDSKESGWEGGIGKQVFGETWVTHHGKHNYQSTRGIIAPGKENHPIAKGIAPGSIWGPTDVYGVRLPLAGSDPIVLGQVVEGVNPDDSAATGEQNDPMMPIAWTRTYTGKSGKSARVFTSTMGS